MIFFYTKSEKLAKVVTIEFTFFIIDFLFIKEKISTNANNLFKWNASERA